MIGRGLACASLAAACLMAAPATEAASPLDIPSAAPPQFRAVLREKLHASEPRRSADSRIELGFQHGYRLMVVGEGNLVALVVERNPGLSHILAAARSSRRPAVAQAVTAYVTRGTVTPTRIEGSFGSLGDVAVRFHPSGRTIREDPKGCRGNSAYRVRHGTFVGHIRFTGENGYVSVRAHRARGRVRTPRHLRCRGRRLAGPHRRARSAGRRRRDGRAGMFVERRTPTTSTELFAFQTSRISLLLALAEESRGRMAVFHYVLALVRGRILTHDDALTSATLRPPRPFHGTGTYSAAPDGTKTWSGSLSVAFPGTPRQSLTGAGFTSQLSVGF
jgi:hypothetical protein